MQDEKAINFKINAQIYKDMKYRILELDITMKDYIINLILKDLEVDLKQKEIV